MFGHLDQMIPLNPLNFSINKNSQYYKSNSLRWILFVIDFDLEYLLSSNYIHKWSVCVYLFEKETQNPKKATREMRKTGIAHKKRENLTCFICSCLWLGINGSQARNAIEGIHCISIWFAIIIKSSMHLSHFHWKLSLILWRERDDKKYKELM